MSFVLPTVGPTTMEEEESWAELDDIISGGELSSCIGRGTPRIPKHFGLCPRRCALHTVTDHSADYSGPRQCVKHNINQHSQLLSHQKSERCERVRSLWVLCPEAKQSTKGSFAVVLEDVGSALTYSRAKVKHIVETSNYGTSSSYRFLQGTHDSKKRRCLAFYVDNIPEKLRSKLLDVTTKESYNIHWSLDDDDGVEDGKDDDPSDKEDDDPFPTDGEKKNDDPPPSNKEDDDPFPSLGVKNLPPSDKEDDDPLPSVGDTKDDDLPPSDKEDDDPSPAWVTLKMTIFPPVTRRTTTPPQRR
ncbi:uncharacterized protein LOC135351419 [Halichondria panicea]|uniref:uncharacterized protein LOC135351419 n=1 Tax=Halichondria panicea TaxID=6063 RepID=UPI00312B4BCF